MRASSRLGEAQTGVVLLPAANGDGDKNNPGVHRTKSPDTRLGSGSVGRPKVYLHCTLSRTVKTQGRARKLPVRGIGWQSNEKVHWALVHRV